MQHLVDLVVGQGRSIIPLPNTLVWPTYGPAMGMMRVDAWKWYGWHMVMIWSKPPHIIPIWRLSCLALWKSYVFGKIPYECHTTIWNYTPIPIPYLQWPWPVYCGYALWVSWMTHIRPVSAHFLVIDMKMMHIFKIHVSIDPYHFYI